MTESRTAEGLIREMERRQDCACPDCGATLCSHQVLMNISMGFGDGPRCWRCLAEGLERDAEQLRDYLVGYLQQRECYRTAWTWADGNESVVPGGPRRCLNFEHDEKPKGAIALGDEEESSEKIGTLTASSEWDAGDMGCGDLILELRLRLEGMKAGEVMKLSARDAGAREDLPAWCRLTGHVLLRAEHPTYWIKRKR